MDLYPLTRIASGDATWPKLCFGLLEERPPKAAYASPRKRGEVKRRHQPLILASATAFLNSAFIASEIPWLMLTSK